MQEYTASLANCSTEGGFSIRNLMDAPSSLFGKMVGFMQNSAMQSSFGAQQKFAYLGQTGAFASLGNNAAAPMYQQLIFTNLYKEEMKAHVDAETKKMNAEETKLRQRLAVVENELKFIESDDQKVAQVMDKDAKNVPTYGLG